MGSLKKRKGWRKQIEESNTVTFNDEFSVEYLKECLKTLEKQELERYKKRKENQPNFEEMIEAIKNMDDNRYYCIAYHPIFGFRYFLGKFWKSIYQIK